MGQEPCPIPTNKGGRMPPRLLKLLTILVRILIFPSGMPVT